MLIHFRKTSTGPVACRKPMSVIRQAGDSWVTKDVTKITCKECTKTSVVHNQAKGELEQWRLV